MTLKILMTVVFVVFLAVNGFAEEGHDHDHHEPRKNEEAHHDDTEETSSTVGPGKAVEAIDAHEKRFKLSAKAQASIGLKTAPMKALEGNRFSVPVKSVVEFGTEFGVYVVRSGWIQMTEVEVGGEKKSGSERVVRSPELKATDSIAVEGVPLLRAAELEAFGQGGHGHAH